MFHTEVSNILRKSENIIKLFYLKQNDIFAFYLNTLINMSTKILGAYNKLIQVRERSARSVPMGSQSRASRTSLTASTPDSLSDNESGTVSRSARKPISFRSNLTPGGSRPESKPNSRPSSRPASRTGSKPPSRHGSNLSLDSTGMFTKLFNF